MLGEPECLSVSEWVVEGFGFCAVRAAMTPLYMLGEFLCGLGV